MTELTDRMRTCAAHIQATNPSELMIMDAASLLLEAAVVLEQPVEVLSLGEPIPPPLPNTQIDRTPVAYWVGDDLKPIPNQPISKNACPNCDSRTTKIMRAAGRKIELECPVCSFRWER